MSFAARYAAGRRVRVESRTRTYHTRVELLSGQAVEFGDDPEPSALCRLLGELRGVETVVMMRYAVSIGRGAAWRWVDIEPRILEILDALEAAERLMGDPCL